LSVHRGNATAVAATLGAPGVTNASTSVLVVDVGGHRSGLPAEVVLELQRMVAVVPLPGAPVVVDGVIDVRGAVVPVIDLRARFGLPGCPPAPSEHLVLVRARDRTVALRVDRVLDLVEIASAAVASASGLPAGPHLRGVTVLEDGLLLIHDAEAFLSDYEVAVLDEALVEWRRPAGVEP
jgi:purine-binding chemotaxis protein CheW